MSGDPKGGDDELGEDGEEAEREKLNPDLLSACMRNDTEAAIRLIEQMADPCCEDHRQWSPLIWAASHGNEDLTRLLISKNAANMYKYDESMGKVKKKKHSPLHWAAFKGHLKVLWLLMSQKLSHHDRDAIGNTALHQAAAGGSMECTKCLMAQGVDVFAKNDRGHTPYVLCTVPEVQNLLQKAMMSVACKATGRQFSSTVLRFMCSWSLDVFCESAITQILVYETPDAPSKEKPVTWCTEVRSTIQDVEAELSNAMLANQLEVITTALENAQDKPVDCKLVFQCEQVKAKLESEIQLEKSMTVQVVTNLDEFKGVLDALSLAIGDAELKRADPTMVAEAKTLRRRLISEASLMRAMEGAQKTTPGHITMLEELAAAAKAEVANAELVDKATRLIAKLKSEREVQQRIVETKPLCEVASFKDLKEEERMPKWAYDTEKFEAFHEDYKQVVETGEGAAISPALMDQALEQLAKIEQLLVERKQTEEEIKLKTSKKKGKK